MFSQFDGNLKYIGESNREQLSLKTVYIMNEQGEYLHKDSYEFWSFWKEKIVLHEKEEFSSGVKNERTSRQRILGTLYTVFPTVEWPAEQFDSIWKWTWGEATIH